MDVLGIGVQRGGSDRSDPTCSFYRGSFKFQVQRVNDGAGAHRLPAESQSRDIFSDVVKFQQRKFLRLVPHSYWDHTREVHNQSNRRVPLIPLGSCAEVIWPKGPRSAGQLLEP